MARHLQKLAAQERGECEFFLAWDGELAGLVGFVTLLWKSKYAAVGSSIAGDLPEMNAPKPTLKATASGTALIVLRRARGRGKRGAHKIGLAVEHDNESARRLYERLGYVDWGTGTSSTIGSTSMTTVTRPSHTPMRVRTC